MSVLDRILAAKRAEVAAARAARPPAVLEAALAAVSPPRDLLAALRRPAGAPVRVLAEIKRASPSAGPIRPGADPAEIARAYAAGGAAAISVLTDREFFDGDLAFIAAVRAVVPLPVLRKDFLIDPYQVLEARAAGADAVLLIVAALDDGVLAALMAEARRLGMAALVEVHDAAEADRAVAAGATLVGINHRNLATFALDRGLTAALAPRLPGGTVIVAESGIGGAADVLGFGRAGADAVLIGETLMRATSPAAQVRALAGERPDVPAEERPVRVKVCGVTRETDAAVIARAGIDYIGLNLWKGSPRHVEPARARALAAAARAADPTVTVVAVMVDPDDAELDAVFEWAGVNLVQLHGDEPAARVAFRLGRAFKGLPLAADTDLATLHLYGSHILLDTPSALRGGSGRTGDWDLARRAVAALAPRDVRVFLAGGLHPGNVAQAIAAVQPWAVDVASGVESAPGIKDPAKIDAFIAAVRAARRPR